MIDNDPRIKEYQYLKQLNNYMKDAPKKYIDGKDAPFIYPKQLEIHLPSDRQTACNLHCKHCFANLYERGLGRWETEGLKLLHNLKGEIPYHIMGGAYCEPTASSFLFPYIDTIKSYGNHFGVHTNGTYLKELEENHRFLTNVNEVSTDKQDYISVSLDAGNGISWSKLKGKKSKEFWNILDGIETMCNIRDKKGKDSHAIRIVYLASEPTASLEEFEFITSFAKMHKVDSLRFSVPYDFYNRDFEDVKKYKNEKEDILAEKISKWLKPLVSKEKTEVPYIFWNTPYWTDIDRFDFENCFYGFFQITLSADGHIYPCSAVASPSAKHLRRGVVDSNLKEFERQCWDIQNNPVKCKPDCFDRGLRGNRMALEINEEFNKMYKHPTEALK